MKPVIKPELQVKFLQHLNRKKKGDEGFTLIELLVVVIIIGVLAAIALPSLLGQISKAKQSEAKQNVGAINRAQQAYFLENSVFTTSVQAVGIGVKTQTENFKYEAFTDADSALVGNWGSSIKPALRSYFGVVGTTLGGTGSGTEVLTVAFACESIDPVQATPSGPPTSTVDCPTIDATYKNMGK
ncbi:type IV pilin-like G/H family protein [Iningainema tapete]|uniref:Prepilin-type N-terminal cleavage/methylation domain-containing protein n=1 Tax=Iningainema tapete BLCC-T55 TaxID=2748662 RepID=A0A8J6XJ64_9CYAN|nr:type IV pilin-like G/H family protein [Iningainema tapete]MBD2773426.1 prepilin-type N-terminal cleavage/methylation domain-containing protein [Iningainema tapete BLCC-T55]